MAQFELLVEELEEPLSVCFFDGPAVSSREKRADEALSVFTRVIARHFDADILRSRAETAPASASESASFARRRRRSDDLESRAARCAIFEAVDRQIAEHKAIARRGIRVGDRTLDFEPLERDSRHTVLLSERVHVCFLTAVDAGPE